MPIQLPKTPRRSAFDIRLPPDSLEKEHGVENHAWLKPHRRRSKVDTPAAMGIDELPVLGNAVKGESATTGGFMTSGGEEVELGSQVFQKLPKRRAPSPPPTWDQEEKNIKDRIKILKGDEEENRKKLKICYDDLMDLRERHLKSEIRSLKAQVAHSQANNAVLYGYVRKLEDVLRLHKLDFPEYPPSPTR